MRRFTWRLGAVAASLLVSTTLLLPSAHADGLTVFPSTLNFSDTFRGGEYLTAVGVENNAPVEATFRFQKEGGAAAWLTLVDPRDRKTEVDTVVVGPHGQGELFAKLVVPSTTANGNYGGTLTVLRSLNGETSSSGGTSGSASVNIGARVAINVNVSGTQRIQGSLDEVAIADTEVGYPVQVVATIRNTGNVMVQPKITLDVLANAGVAATGESADEAVYPNETKQVAATVDTSKLAPGDMQARVRVVFGDKDLGVVNKPFKLLPRGTLTRRGELDSLTLTSVPEAGATAKVVARFRNTGQIESKAAFIGELYRNGTLIKGITGIERSVPKGEESVLEVFVDIPRNGDYRLTGKVNFEGNESAVKELAFTVGAGAPIYLYGGVAASGIVLVLGLVAIVWTRRRRKSEVFARARVAGRAHGPMS